MPRRLFEVRDHEARVVLRLAPGVAHDFGSLRTGRNSTVCANETMLCAMAAVEFHDVRYPTPLASASSTFR
jgi:hypothetical protein